MIDKKVFYNLKCDCCGQLIDEQYWDEEEGVTAFIDDCGWKATEDGKHYCMDCYHIDDNDRIVIKDGHVYDDEGYPLSESDIMFNNALDIITELTEGDPEYLCNMVQNGEPDWCKDNCTCGDGTIPIICLVKALKYYEKEG